MSSKDLPKRLRLNAARHKQSSQHDPPDWLILRVGLEAADWSEKLWKMSAFKNWDFFPMNFHGHMSFPDDIQL